MNINSYYILINNIFNKRNSQNIEQNIYYQIENEMKAFSKKISIPMEYLNLLLLV